MGLSSRVVVTVALRDRGHAFGRKPIPVGYALPTEGRPTGPVDSPERKASELLLPLQRLLPTGVERWVGGRCITSTADGPKWTAPKRWGRFRMDDGWTGELK